MATPFDYVAGYSATAALSFLSIPAILTFWGLSLKRRRSPSPIQSRPLRVAHLLFKISPPIYATGVLLNVPANAIFAARSAGSITTVRDFTTGRYLGLLSSFLVNAGSIGLTLVLYMVAVGSVYVAHGRMTWWKLIRLDAPIGGGILLIFDVAWFARRLHTVSSGRTTWAATLADTRSVGWLLFVMELTIAMLAMGVFWASGWVINTLTKRGEDHVVTRAMGKAPVLIMISSFLWIIRSLYWVVDIVKDMNESYTIDESNASLIIYPIIEYWINAAVTGMLLFVIRNPVWSDSSIQHFDGSHDVQSQPQPQPGGPSVVVMAQVPSGSGVQGPVVVPVPVQYVHVQQQPQQQPGQGQGQPPPPMYVYPQPPPQQQQQPAQPGQQQPPVYYTNAPPPNQQYQHQGQGQPQVVYVQQYPIPAPAGSPPPPAAAA